MDAKKLRVKSSWVHRLLGLGAELIVSESGIEVVTSAGRKFIPFTMLGSMADVPGLVWDKLKLEYRGGEAAVECFGGFSRREVLRLLGCVLELQYSGIVEAAWAELRQLLAEDRYLNWQRWYDWQARYHEVFSSLAVDIGRLPASADFAERLREVMAWLWDEQRQRAARNRTWVETELRKFEMSPGMFGVHGLSESQRRAIVSDEDRTLVVAGAGTGKTTVLVGKAAYLLRRGLARPDQILLVTYTRSVCEEMKQRVRQACGTEIPHVHTFHSLGYQIVGEVEGKKPDLARWSDNPDELPQLIKKFVNSELGRDDSPLAKFLAYYPYPDPEESGLLDEKTRLKYLKSYELRSLKGERVKSYGELRIANFLALHGVEYEYEARYEYSLADSAHREYRPDFRLTGYGPPGIYIEYFGIDERGNTSPSVNREKYLREIEWKKRVHAQYRTRLIDLYYYQLKAGQLERELKERLLEAGVTLRKVDLRKFLTRPDGSDAWPLRIFVDLLTQFLNLYRENNLSPQDILGRLATWSSGRHRAEVFLEVFWRFLSFYQRELEESGAIDFSDMITRATQYVRSGRWRSPFLYLLIDEFQDISRGRAALLKALLDQNPNCRLFAVGDDWQSIFRFAGNDIHIMVDFANHFGKAPSAYLRVDLPETFRLSVNSLKLSSRFIQKNPHQLRKELKPGTYTQDTRLPAVFILYEEDEEELLSSPERLLKRCYEKLQGHAAYRPGLEPSDRDVSILVLARYNHFLPKWPARVKWGAGTASVTVSTVHRAKGLEADYVIVLYVVSGQYGFPTEITDDPLLDLVLSAPEPVHNAEERRLFYVALTRARRCTFIVTNPKNKSAFVEELEREEYAGLVETESQNYETTDRVCPLCGGRLIRRMGKSGEFYGCEFYPYCDGYVPARNVRK